MKRNSIIHIWELIVICTSLFILVSSFLLLADFSNAIKICLSDNYDANLNPYCKQCFFAEVTIHILVIMVYALVFLLPLCIFYIKNDKYFALNKYIRSFNHVFCICIIAIICYNFLLYISFQFALKYEFDPFMWGMDPNSNPFCSIVFFRKMAISVIIDIVCIMIGIVLIIIKKGKLTKNNILLFCFILTFSSCSIEEDDEAFLVNHFWEADNSAVIDFRPGNWLDSVYSICLYNFDDKTLVPHHFSIDEELIEKKNRVLGAWQISNKGETIKKDNAMHIIFIQSQGYQPLKLSYNDYMYLSLNVQGESKTLIFKRRRYLNIIDYFY